MSSSTDEINTKQLSDEDGQVDSDYFKVLNDNLDILNKLNKDNLLSLGPEKIDEIGLKIYNYTKIELVTRKDKLIKEALGSYVKDLRNLVVHMVPIHIYILTHFSLHKTALAQCNSYDKLDSLLRSTKMDFMFKQHWLPDRIDTRAKNIPAQITALQTDDACNILYLISKITVFDYEALRKFSVNDINEIGNKISKLDAAARKKSYPIYRHYLTLASSTLTLFLQDSLNKNKINQDQINAFNNLITYMTIPYESNFNDAFKRQFSPYNSAQTQFNAVLFSQPNYNNKTTSEGQSISQDDSPLLILSSPISANRHRTTATFSRVQTASSTDTEKDLVIDLKFQQETKSYLEKIAQLNAQIEQLKAENSELLQLRLADAVTNTVHSERESTASLEALTATTENLILTDQVERLKFRCEVQEARIKSLTIQLDEEKKKLAVTLNQFAMVNPTVNISVQNLVYPNSPQPQIGDVNSPRVLTIFTSPPRPTSLSPSAKQPCSPTKKTLDFE